MSDPKLISPLLDNFLMGDAISEHNGIRCCPAMDNLSGNKYIVKIISLPPSETQLNALLLTGALADEAAAQSYYEDRAKELTNEIEVLQQLANHEGFLPCAGYQTVPNDSGVGVDVYMLTDYRRSLERQFTKSSLTQLDALNLGIDLCSALTACRRNGYLFINLKPSNIYVTPNKEYKISDLGFLSLSGLKYATFPEQYISAYTAPEVLDSFSVPSTTLDVYALGMVLYRIFNGDVLPDTAGALLSAPAYADEEMSAIILKACNPNPEERWADPAQMGQALIGYMQKNGAFDVPIVPSAPVVEEPVPEAVEAEPEAADAVPPDSIEEESSEESVPGAENAEPIVSPTEDNASQEAVPVIPVLEKEPSAEISEPAEQSDSPDEPEIDAEDISYDEVTDEVSQMLSQADFLASMEVPDPVVAPEAVDIVLPVDQSASDEEAEGANDSEEAEDLEQLSFIAEAELLDDTDSQDDEIVEDTVEDNEKRRKYFPWLIGSISAAVAAILILGGFLFYKFYYLQTIDSLTVDGSRDSVTVTVESETDESLLSISCTDIYGQALTVPVIDGKAEFSGLKANAQYQISVNISGFHGLTGETKYDYFTPDETKIIQCSVVTGNVPGSAILNFTPTGPDSEQWVFTYGPQGQEQKSCVFTGHTFNMTDLVEGVVYSGILTPKDELYISKTQEITFTATEVIQANSLTVTEFMNGKLTAKWTIPESVTVSDWSVRCYNDQDFDQTITTQDPIAVFSGIDHKDSYTVEVTAAGQSITQSVTVEANSITVFDLTAGISKAGEISLSWNANQTPKDGWIVSYYIEGTEISDNLACSENSVVIRPIVPELTYVFTVRAPSAPVVCEPLICTTAAAKDFYVNYAGNPVSKNNLRFSLCKTPSFGGWTHKDLKATDYTTTFAPDQKASFVIFLNRVYDISREMITSTFVIRDANEQIVDISWVAHEWSSMWYKNYCELDIPSMPTEPGSYTITVYFNGQFATKQPFSISD